MQLIGLLGRVLFNLTNRENQLIYDWWESGRTGMPFLSVSEETNHFFFISCHRYFRWSNVWMIQASKVLFMVAADDCPMHGIPLFSNVSMIESFNGCCRLPPPDCFGSWSIWINHDLAVFFLGHFKNRCFIVFSRVLRNSINHFLVRRSVGWLVGHKWLFWLFFAFVRLLNINEYTGRSKYLI